MKNKQKSINYGHCVGYQTEHTSYSWAMKPFRNDQMGLDILLKNFNFPSSLLPAMCDINLLSIWRWNTLYLLQLILKYLSLGPVRYRLYQFSGSKGKEVHVIHAVEEDKSLSEQSYLGLLAQKRLY